MCPVTILFPSVRSMLTDLIDKTTLATVPPRAHSNNRITTSGDAQNTHDAAAPLLVRLFDLARFVLGLDSAAKSRCRALALDCLRAGLAIAMGESEVDARDALSLAATGAKDDKWNVRAAAARVVGEVVGGGGDGSNRRLLSLLSSKSVSDTMRILRSSCYFVCIDWRTGAVQASVCFSACNV